MTRIETKKASEGALMVARVILHPFRGRVTAEQISDAADVVQEQIDEQLERLRERNAELLKALKEARAWLPHQEKRPFQFGAKCETSFEVAALIEAAIAAMEKES